MLPFVAILLIAAGYGTAYVVSLFSLAVYIQPEEVDSLFASQTRKRRRVLKQLASDPRALVQVAAVYKSFVLIVITAMTITALGYLFPTTSVRLTYPVGLFVVWLLYMTFIEYLPRRSSRGAISPDRARFLWLVTTIYQLFFPIVLVYRRALLQSGEQENVTEEDKEEIVERAIETLAEQAGISEAIVEPDEKVMIGHIFQLDQTIVREIMSPRVSIAGIEKDSSLAQIRSLIKEDGHSRFPVYEKNIDKILGILYVKDLFNNMPSTDESFQITSCLRRPHFIPETKVIGDLLREFRLRKLHFAVVVDEYGGVSGIVTLEDILEEIVGEIQDEYDSEEMPISLMPDGKYLVDASVSMEDLQETLDTDFEQGEFDTIGGLIYDLAGSVPDEGAVFQWNSLELEVYKREGQRIKYVRVRRLPQTNSSQSPDVDN